MGYFVKFAIIQNGIVANIAEADEAFAATQEGWVPAGSADIGDRHDGKTFAKPEAPPTPDREPYLVLLIQDLLDAFAWERHYGTPQRGSIESAITYDSPDEQNKEWAAEGRRCRVVRSQAWEWWTKHAGQETLPTVAEVHDAIRPLLTWD